MFKKDRPIGVFDSGIGGLSVLKQFIRFIPTEKYIYFGDTARVPYGNRSADTVKQYAVQCAKFLLEKEVKLIVVACNTVSSVALKTVEALSDIPVIGMIEPATSAALRTSVNGKIGVIGTRATINSSAYQEAILRLSEDKKIEVTAQSCPLFVPLVEEGLINHPATKAIAEEYLEIFKQKKIDTLVLGCTHYPLLSQLIAEILPGVNLVDSGVHSAVTAIRMLAERQGLQEEGEKFVFNPNVEFYVSDIPDTFFEIAQRFLGFKVNSPTRIEL